MKYSFLFVRVDGAQLARIATLIGSGVIRPVVDKVFPFARTADAYVVQGPGFRQVSGYGQCEGAKRPLMTMDTMVRDKAERGVESTNEVQASN